MFKKTEYALGLYATYAYTLKTEIASTFVIVARKYHSQTLM